MRRRSLFGALPAALLAAPGLAQPRRLELATYFVGPTLFGDEIQRFADSITHGSDGALAVTVEPQVPWMTLAMIAEASELAHYNAAQHADAEPLLALSTLPMLATSLEEAAVLLRIARPHYEAVLARHGQVLLATEPWRPATLWSTFPIRVAADIRGARFAQANSVSRPPRWHEPFARLGAAPSLYWDAELILVDGMVDGFKFPAEFGHLLELFYAAPLNVLSASRRLLDSLDEARRRLVVAAGREAERALWAFVERRVSREHREAGARRVAVAAQPPAELVAALRDAAEPDIQDWARAMGPAGGAIVAAFRRAVGRP